MDHRSDDRPSDRDTPRPAAPTPQAVTQIHAETDDSRPPRDANSLGLAGWTLFLLTRLALVSVSPAQVGARTYPPPGRVPDHDLNPAHAEFLYKLQREDSAHTDDKVKQLLTLSSSLTTLILVFTRDVQPRWLVAVVLALLVACVYLCASVLEVRTYNAPTLEDAKSDDEGRQWARDVLDSYLANRGRHAFRVDRYRAAGRYFWAAMLATPIVVLFSVPKADPLADAQGSIARMERAVGAMSSTLDEMLRRGLPVRAVQALEVRPVAPPLPAGGTPAVGGEARPRSTAAPSTKRDGTPTKP